MIQGTDAQAKYDAAEADVSSMAASLSEKENQLAQIRAARAQDESQLVKLQKELKV